MADYDWCMTAIDWNWSVEDTSAKLIDVSQKPKNVYGFATKDMLLLLRKNAAAAVAKNDLKRAGARRLTALIGL